MLHKEGLRCGTGVVNEGGAELGGPGGGQHHLAREHLATNLHQHGLGAGVVVQRGEDETGDVGGGGVQVVHEGGEGARGGGQ